MVEPNDIRTRALAMSKDYADQMRSAGFDDVYIRDKLSKNRTINVSSNPQTPVQGQWATGLKQEFEPNMQVPEGAMRNEWSQVLPDVNNYQEFAPGGVANRLPSYSEYSGQAGTGSGKFSQNQNANLMTALNNYIQNYKGSKVPYSQSAAESGFVGLPQELANQWMPEKVSIEQQRASGLSIQAEVQRIREQNQGAGIMPTDDVETALQKAEAYDSYTKEVEASKENKDQNSVIQLDADLQEAFLAGNTPTAEDVMAYGMQYGLKLTLEQAYAIVTLAQKKVAAQTATTAGE